MSHLSELGPLAQMAHCLQILVVRQINLNELDRAEGSRSVVTAEDSKSDWANRSKVIIPEPGCIFTAGRLTALFASGSDLFEREEGSAAGIIVCATRSP
jgi:hypothetical protein